MNDWSDYLIALTVSEAGSHAEASDALAMSQPTISRRLRALEGRLGGPLFKRIGGQLRLTDLGEIVVARAARMREDATVIERAATDRIGVVAGEVTLTAGDGIGTDWLPVVLAPLLASHPELTVHIKLGLGLANLVAGEADIAVRWNGPGQQYSLIARKVASVGVGIYAAPAYLDQMGRPARADDLEAHRAVNWPRGVGFPWPQDENGEVLAPRMTALATASPLGHLTALERGVGLGVTSHRMARCGPVALERVLPDYEPRVDLWLVGHPGVKRNAALRHVFDYIADAVQRDLAHLTEGEPSVFA